MNYWEETWEERAESIKRAYGAPWPPDTVVSFSWRDRIGFPGACALRLPPIEASRDPVRYLREDWLYLTMGLSQPLDEAQVERKRAAGKKCSSYGIELGFVVADQSDWASTALYGFMTHILHEVQINWGDRFALGFSKTEGDKLGVFTGHPGDLDITPFG